MKRAIGELEVREIMETIDGFNGRKVYSIKMDTYNVVVRFTDGSEIGVEWQEDCLVLAYQAEDRDATIPQ